MFNLEPRHFGMITPRDEQADEVGELLENGNHWSTVVMMCPEGFAFECGGKIICIGGVSVVGGKRIGWAIIGKGVPRSSLVKILHFTSEYLVRDQGAPIYATTKINFEAAARTLQWLGFVPDVGTVCIPGYHSWVYGGAS